MSMRTDSQSSSGAGGSHKGRSGLMQSAIPTAFSSSWKYLRNVGGGSGALGEDGTVPLGAPRVGLSAEDNKRKEQVLWASFESLDTAPDTSLRVLLLTYANGFQAWDVHEAGDVKELVSRRDGPVACLRVLPHPIFPEPDDSPLVGARPLLAVVAGGEGFRGGVEEGDSDGGARSSVRMYSLQSHAYVHALRFRTPVLGVQASSRLVAVALSAQIYCFDAATLQNTFSVLTYPAPQLAPGIAQPQQGAMALSHQWLGYAANQPLITPTGRVSPQCLSTPSPTPSTSPATQGSAAHLAAHYAIESSKHLAAGVISLGDMGYKTLNTYVRELMQSEPGGSANGVPEKQATAPPTGGPNEQEYAGTVIIRDVVTRNVVAQFRAHTSPLSALAFDPSGTLVVTASVCGHSLNVFRMTPQSKGVNPSSLGSNGETHSTAHLYRLHRGLTNAIIQDIRFSSDSEWVAVSTTRGTTHMYAVSRSGGHVGPSTHVKTPDRGQPAAATWHAPPGVTLSVVARIRNSNGGWRGSVTGAAAAATGRANMISGAVATCFHSGRARIAPEERAAGFLEEQLYVLSPGGYLLRYWLRPYIGCDSSSANAPEVLKLAIEPRERWDVCRRVSWIEREERVTYCADGGNGALLGGSEIGPIERGVQTGEDALLGGGDGEGRRASPVQMGHPKLFENRPPRHNSVGVRTKNSDLFGGNSDELGAENGLFTRVKGTGGVGGQWERSTNGRGPWQERTPVGNGHVAEAEPGVAARQLMEGDLFDDQNSEGSFEVSQSNSPPSSFESPRYLLHKQFSSSPVPGTFLTPRMLNAPGGSAPVPTLDLDSEGSLPTPPPSTSGDSNESPSPPSPSPRTSPVRLSPKRSPNDPQKRSPIEPQGGPKWFPGGGGGVTSVQGGTAVKAPAEQKAMDSKSPSKDKPGGVSSEPALGNGLNGLNLNGLTIDSLWGGLNSTEDSFFKAGGDGGFLSPVLPSNAIPKPKGTGPSLASKEPPYGVDSSPRLSPRTSSEGDVITHPKQNSRREGKAGEDKGGLLGGLRGLMSSGAQGLAAAVTAVGGAPPRDSLLDLDPPAPVEKLSAKVYQHPIPVGERKKVVPRHVRRVSGGKSRGAGEAKAPNRGVPPAGSRGVSPVGSPRGECFLTQGIPDTRGKLLGVRNGERSHSCENLHAEEGPVFTGAVAEVKAGVKRGQKKELGDEKKGERAEDSGGEEKGEISMDGWEQQGFLEGFSLSEDE